MTHVSIPGDRALDVRRLERLRAVIDANWPQQVGWLQKLVRFPSVRGAESACQGWLCSEFSQRGWSVDRYTLADVDIDRFAGFAPLIGVDPAQSVQVVATVPFNRPSAGRSLILQGHVDVVPPGPIEMWRDPPFSGEVRDGWLLGRGAQDMKMGISALVFALDAIRAAGWTLDAPAYLQTVTEEESTGNGALSTLARGYRADACLIPEPTSNTITRAQTGAIWFKLLVRGKPVHVARSQAGSNAILSTFNLVAALQALTAQFNSKAKDHRWFGAVADPIKFNVGIIRGGDWASSTPAWCEIDCRMGVLPGQRVDEVRGAIADCIRRASQADEFLAKQAPQIVWNGFLAEGTALEPGSDAERLLAAAHQAVFATAMIERLSTAVNDTRYYALYQHTPALCYGPAGTGMHGFDERANLENLKQTTLVIAAFIAEWCGVAGGVAE
jgi:acetylornithine deacetylase